MAGSGDAMDTVEDEASPLGPGMHPWWVNQATVRGAILILAGVALLVLPPGSRDPVARAVGVTLLVWSGAGLWFGTLRGAAPRRRFSTGELLVVLVGGLVLLVVPTVGLTTVVGLALLLWGGVAAIGWLTGGGSGDRWSGLIRPVSFMVFGLVALLVPEALVLGVRAILGGVAALVGGVLLVSGLEQRPTDERWELDAKSASRLGREWLVDQRLDDARYEELSGSLYYEGSNAGAKQRAFWVMMCLATAIATFAVIQDSTAVVIGAMLIAPLMTPIMGASASMANGWRARMMASLGMVAAAVVVSVFLAWVIASWLPSSGILLGTNGQVTSRIEPSLVDLCIALAAGAAGAYATVDDRVSSGLAGVAIAVALVPPLAVVGVTLEAGFYGDAAGAFLLFLTNFVSIILAGLVVFVLAGFAALPPTADQRGALRRPVQTVAVGALLVAIPLALTSQIIWTEESNQADTDDAVESWLGDQADGFTTEIMVEGNRVTVTVSGADEPPAVAPLKQDLEERIGSDAELEVVFIPARRLTSSG